MFFELILAWRFYSKHMTRRSNVEKGALPYLNYSDIHFGIFQILPVEMSHRKQTWSSVIINVEPIQCILIHNTFVTKPMIVNFK